MPYLLIFVSAVRRNLPVTSLKTTLRSTNGNNAIMYVLLTQEISDLEILSLHLSRVSTLALFGAWQATERCLHL